MEVSLLQIGERGVCGLSAEATRSAVQVRGAFADALEKPFESIPAEERGPALLAVLKRNSFEDRRVTLVIPRRFAILREFTVPPGGPEELPSMVRFQLEKELPVPIERIRYTWREIGRRDGQITIQTASVPEEVLEPLRAALSEAGLRVSAVILGTMGLAELLSDNPEEGVAIEYTFDESVEVLARTPEGAVHSQSASIQNASEEEVVEQIQRMLMTHHEQIPGTPVSKLITTTQRKGLPEALAPATACEALDLRAVLKREDRIPPPEISALIGAARGLASRSPALKDLLAPPVPKKRSKTATAVRVGLLAGLVILGLPIYLGIVIADRKAEIQALEKKTKGLKKAEKRLKEVQAKKETVEKWRAKRPRWIDVMADLTDIVDTKVLYVTNLSFDDRGNATISGRAKRKQDASELVQDLNASNRFETAILVAAQENPERRRRSRREEHPVDFTIKAEVRPNGEQIR